MNCDSELSCSYDVKDLIRLVKSYPIIYDASRTDFKNFDRKEKVWCSIAAAINISVEECRRRWRTLRERYTRELKRIKFYGEDSVWENFGEMIFLNQFIKCRQTRKRRFEYDEIIKDPLEDSEISWSDVKTKSHTSQLPNRTEVEPPSVVSATVGPKTAVDDDDNIHNEDFFSVERLDDIISYPSPPNKTAKFSHNDHSYTEPEVPSNCENRNDEDGLFCESIAFSLRRLSRLNNIKAKVEIYKVLERLTESEERKFKSVNSYMN